MVSNLINIGDKIDIRILQQVEKEKNEGIMAKVYKSRVQDIKKDNLLEVSMPIYAGKMVILSVGIRYECIFYTKNGLYRCVAQVKGHYKVDGLYMLLLELKSPLEKFQRREYFRFECAMDIEYYKITEDEAKIEEIEELKRHHKEYEPEMEINHAIAVDLSGGGIRFMAEEEGKKDEYLFISMLLRSLDNSQLLEIAGRVLYCNRVEGDRGKKKYEYRVQFLTRDQKKREAVIKYIFEQERKSRQKG